MAKLTFKEELCKGCGLCVTACPKKILALDSTVNAKGYHPAGITNQEECIGCTSCGAHDFTDIRECYPHLFSISHRINHH